MSQLLGQIEADAVNERTFVHTELSLLSIAVSMKRIADMMNTTTPSSKSYAEIVEPYAAAMRMIRDAIEELFGPVANLKSEEAVLLAGPEPQHDAEAVIEALRNVDEAFRITVHKNNVDAKRRRIEHYPTILAVDGITIDDTLHLTITAERGIKVTLRFDEKDTLDKLAMICEANSMPGTHMDTDELIGKKLPVIFVPSGG